MLNVGKELPRYQLFVSDTLDLLVQLFFPEMLWIMKFVVFV
jgi:hypothetical protein